MAAIAAVQMQLPDPPPLSKGIETTDEILERAAELHRSNLLKYGDWNPDKHPRTGIPPNPGWFATVEGDAEPSWRVAAGDFPDEEEEEPEPLEPSGEGGQAPHYPGQGLSLLLPVPGGLPFLFRPARPAPEVPNLGAPRSTTPQPSLAQPKLPFPGGLPPQRAPLPAGQTRTRWGRLGIPTTREQNADIATGLKALGYEITHGAGEPEEYIKGEGPGIKGSTFVDITAIHSQTGEIVRVQTVDTLADGVTPKKGEREAEARIRAARPNDKLLIIPKRRTP